MHVGDLDGSAETAAKSRWSATVEIEVHDAGDSPVAGATVDGYWSGVSGEGSWVTGTDGRCSITKDNIKSNVVSVTFTVDDITLGSRDEYNPAANHSTSITITKP